MSTATSHIREFPAHSKRTQTSKVVFLYNHKKISSATRHIRKSPTSKVVFLY